MNKGKSIIRHAAKCLLAAVFVCSPFQVSATAEIVLDDPLAVTTLSAADSSARLYRVDAGRLVVAHPGALENAQVIIAAGAVLRFTASCSLSTSDAIAGAGTVEVGRGAVVEAHARFAGFTGKWVLDGGKVISRRFDAESLLGLFRFDDTANPYADSSPRNIGLAVGYDVAANGAGSNNPQIVDDAERGKVLYLDGASWLTGTGANGVQPGFDIGSSPFTLAMWVKTDSNSTIDSAYKNGTMFMCGGGGSGKRLIFRFNGSIMKLLYSNWGDDLQFPTTVGTDGGAWVHYAVTHDGAGTIRLYVNGELASTNVGKNGAVPNIAAVRLCIGYAINYTSSTGDINPFKGYMDDIVFAKSVLPIADLMHVGDVLSGDPAENFADITNLGGGEFDPGTNLVVSVDARLAAKGADAVLRDNAVESWEFETGTGETATTNTFTLNGFSANGSALPCVSFPFDASRGDRVAMLDGSKQAYLATADEGGVAQPYPADYPLGGNPFTLSMWVKTDAADKTGIFWFGNPNWEADKGFSMRLNDSNSKVTMAYGGNFNIDVGGSGLSVWRHIAITYADSEIKLYVDGTCKKTVNYTVSVDVSGNYNLFYLGRYHSSPVYGTICFDNVRVYRKALSADEIALDKSTGTVRCLAPSGTLGTAPVVTVDAGQTWTVDAATESIAGLSGAGTVILTNDAQVTVANDARFHGVIQGEGSLAVAPGYEFSANAAGAVAPIVCNATLALPASAAVVFECPSASVANGDYILATGDPIVPPADFSNWSWRDSAGASSGSGSEPIDVRFSVSGNSLVMRVARHGTVITFR